MKTFDSPTKILFYQVLIVLTICFTSCSNESFEELVPEGTENPTVTPDEPDNTSTDPCDFKISDLTADSTKAINCLLDLNGETFTVPANVKLDFDGGDIINGTLIFTGSTSTIDGRLLSSKLDVKGDVTLKDPKFRFYPVRWNIVEGVTNVENATKNRENVNKTIELVQRLGGNVFEIDRMDAYFETGVFKVSRETMAESAIRVPSNMHFMMSDNTFLRVQPNKAPAYALVSLYTTDNTIVSGGHLVGDRYEHDYTPVVDVAGVRRDDHGYGFVLHIIGTHNTVIDGIHISNSTGEGINITSKTVRTSDGQLIGDNRTTENLVIKNSVIVECRRNNIAVVDANGVLIDNCDIIDAGLGEQLFDSAGKIIYNSAGVAPRYGLDIEALRYVSDDGNTIDEINKITNVTVSNSTFKGNHKGDIDIYTCNDVIIENNNFDGWVANFAAHDIIIRNNEFNARPNMPYAIILRSEIKGTRGELNYNYEVTGNTISGYQDAIKVAGKNYLIANNICRDFKVGIQLGDDLVDSQFYGNSLISTREIAFGYTSIVNARVDNVTISDETIEVTHRPINYRGLNIESNTNTLHVTMENCKFKTSSGGWPIWVENSKNLSINNSTLTNTQIETINSTNIVTEGNVTM